MFLGGCVVCGVHLLGLQIDTSRVGFRPVRRNDQWFFSRQRLTGAEGMCSYLSHSTSPFLWWIFFKIGSHELFAWGWLWNTILLISASQVARIRCEPPVPGHYLSVLKLFNNKMHVSVYQERHKMYTINYYFKYFSYPSSSRIPVT
jgi:hypothetical protein